MNWRFAMTAAGITLLCGLTVASCRGQGSEPRDAGRAAFEQLGCGSCHGADGEGLRTAPPLRGLSQTWTEDQLVEFLRDPRTFRAQTPRLQILAERYPVDMAGFSHVPDQTLRAVSRYVLTK